MNFKNKTMSKENIKREVKRLLTSSPALRDDRETVLWRVLKNNSGITREDAIKYAQFYKQMASIDRYWRQVQEQNPELQGKEWEARQRKQEKVKKDLGY